MQKNLVRLIGYIGQHLSATTIPTGKRRVHLRVATHQYKLRNGNKEYHTVWHDVIAWGNIAEYAERSFVKGSKVMVEGSIEYLTYPDHTGHIRYVTQIFAQSLLNLDR